MKFLIITDFRMFMLPFSVHSLAAVEDDDHFRSYVIASAAGIFGLFPLLIKTAGKCLYFSLDTYRCRSVLNMDRSHFIETPVKIIFSLVWGAITFASLRKVVYQ